MNFVRWDGRKRRSRVRRHARSRVCVWMCALEHSLSARGGTGQQTEREARGGALPLARAQETTRRERDMQVQEPESSKATRV